MQQTPHPVPPNDGRTAALRSLAPVFYYFFVGGIFTVMLGPLLPVFIQRWDILDSQAGTLFAVNFAGQLSRSPRWCW